MSENFLSIEKSHFTFSWELVGFEPKNIFSLKFNYLLGSLVQLDERNRMVPLLVESELVDVGVSFSWELVGFGTKKIFSLKNHFSLSSLTK